MRVASVLLLFVVTPGSADEPVKLRWSIQEGDTFYVTTQVNQDHTLVVDGKKAETAIRLDLTLRYYVKRVTSGETEVEVSYLAVGVRADGIPSAEKVGEKVRGCTITLRLDDDHIPTAMKGLDEILKKFRDASSTEQAAAAILFGEAGVRELAGRPFDILLREGVRVGGTATRPDRGTVGGLTTTGKTTSKLERVEDGVATVAMTSEFAITAGDGPDKQAFPDAKLVLKSDRAVGKYTFDNRAGRLKEFSHESVIRGSLTAPVEGKEVVVELTIRQKQTLIVSDKNPILVSEPHTASDPSRQQVGSTPSSEDAMTSAPVRLWTSTILSVVVLSWCVATPQGAASGQKPATDDKGTRKLLDKQKEVKAAFRGTWELVGAPTSRAESQRWTFDEEFVTTEVRFDAKDVRKSKYRYQINPLRDPSELTLHNEAGLLQGIYRLDGDTLTVATGGISEVERPKGFTRESAGELVSSLVVLTFKRAGGMGDSGWEGRAVKVLTAADRDGLRTLAGEFQKLPAETRRSLPVAIRDDAVEFTYRGELATGESLSFVEYLIAGEDKGYETLLVAPEAELKRLPTLRPFFDKHGRNGRRDYWTARLLWVEDGKPRSADLGDIFGLLSAKDRAEFLDGQEVDENGYFGGEYTTGKNVQCDLAVLPRKPGPVVLQITLRLAAQK